MLATWAALLSACALQQAAAQPEGGTLELGIAVEGRTTFRRDTTREATDGAHTAPDQVIRRHFQELEAVPRIQLADRGARGSISLAYAPRLVVSSEKGGSYVLHQLTWAGSAVASPELTLLSSVEGRLGKADLLQIQLQQLGGSAQGGSQAVPVPEHNLINYEFLQASAGIRWVLTPRERLAATALYLQEGGATSYARSFMPLGRGGRATLSLASQVGRIDVLDSLLEASQRHFIGAAATGATSVWTAQLAESWHHRFFPHAEWWLGAGVGATGTPRAGPLLPTGSAGLSVATVDEHSQLRATADYAPFIDPVTGRAYPRVDGNLSLLWGPSTHWRLGANGSWGSVLTGSQKGQSSLTGELRITWAAIEELQLSTGVRTTAQWPGPIRTDGGGLSVRQWVFFLAVNGTYKRPI